MCEGSMGPEATRAHVRLPACGDRCERGVMGKKPL